MKIQNTYLNRIIFAVLGFGLGGALWGIEAYRGTVGSDEVFTNPFSYILGAVTLGVFGGLALAYLSQLNGSFSMSRLVISRQTWKIVGFGTFGWLVGFVVPRLFMELPLVTSNIFFIIPGILLSIPNMILGISIDVFSTLTKINITQALSLEPSIVIGQIAVEFLLAGAIIGLTYSFILKTKILRTILWSAGGFAVAALVGPILGNLIGNLFGSLFVSYLVTFLIIGVVLGFSLLLSIKNR